MNREGKFLRNLRIREKKKKHNNTTKQIIKEKKITIGFCCKEKDYDFYNYIKGLGDDIDVIMKQCDGINHTLTRCYNEIINESKTDIVITMHNDVYFEYMDRYPDSISNIFIKLFEETQDCGIFGVIGGSSMFKSTPKWACGATNGHVIQGYKYKEKGHEYVNLGDLVPFSWDVKEALTVDGLFLAINKKRIKSLFDETNHSFNFYDLDFCISNKIRGCKVYVTKTILLRHESEGDFSKKYSKDSEYFLKKYDYILPLNVNDDISNNISEKQDKPTNKRFFDKVICLHLSESKDREESVLKEVKKVNIEDIFEFWYVTRNFIDEKSAKPYEKYYKKIEAYENSNLKGITSVFSCSKGHYEIVKTSFERGLENILVVEDDFVFKDKNSFNELEKFMRKLPNDYCCAKIYYYDNYKQYNGLTQNKKDENGVYNLSFMPTGSTKMYALNRDGMKNVMEIYEKEGKPYVADQIYGSMKYYVPNRETVENIIDFSACLGFESTINELV